MHKLIEQMAKKTGVDWFTIMYALEDRGVINSADIKKIEDYFFELNETKAE